MRVPPSSDRDDELMRTYLLGTITDAARDELESRIFASDEDYERLLDLEADLIDAYARGELSEEDRRRVEQRLVPGPEGSLRVRLARAILQRSTVPAAVTVHTRTTSAPSTSPLWIAAAATLLVALGTASGWLVTENARLRREIVELQAAPTSTSVTPPAAPTSAPESTPAVATWTLDPRSLRSPGDATTFDLSAGTRFVRLRLPVGEALPNAIVAIERSGVGRVWTQRGVDTDTAQVIELWLPSEVLPPGEHELIVWRERESDTTLAAVSRFRVR